MSCFLYAKHIIIHLKARYNIMKIREFCKMKKITQEKLAEDLNVDVRTIRRWESSTPSTRIILKLILSPLFNGILTLVFISFS